MQYYAKQKSLHQLVSLTTTGSRSKAPYRSLIEPNGMEPEPIVYPLHRMQHPYQLAIDTASKSRQLV
ncbi:hypothetical protein [Paenibacillus sp. RU26A]|nr:hypothetical protein [Paenibacillus sp. RU26A]